MPDLRVRQCDICGESIVEPVLGLGFPGWGRLTGAAPEDPLPGQDSLVLCPKHLSKVTGFVNTLLLEEEKKNGHNSQ